MQQCPACGHTEPAISRFCTHCGTALRSDMPPPEPSPQDQRVREELNLPVLYAMVGILVMALLVPPWETPPGQPPAFLGFHFVFARPESGADHGIISRLLLTIEL